MECFRLVQAVILLSSLSSCIKESGSQELYNSSYFSTLSLNVQALQGSRWSLEQSSIITVYHAFEIVDMTKVDVDGMCIRVEFHMRQRWTASGLELPKGLFKNADPENTFITSDDSVLKSVWSPDSFIPNGLDTKIHSLNEENSVVNIYKNKTIVFKAKMYSVLGCSFTFEWYPLDIQTCDLVFESYRFTDRVVKYEWEPGDAPVTMSPKIILYQYDVDNPPKRGKGVHKRWGGRFNYPYVKVMFRFERKLGNNIIQVFTPTILVTTLSFFSFWLGLDAIPGRISLLVTSILTIVTMHSGLKGSVPTVHYIKMMDIWMIGCMCFVFGAICEFIIVKYLSWRHQQAKNAKEEREKFLRDRQGHGQTNPLLQLPTNQVQNKISSSEYPINYDQHPYLQFLRNADETGGKNAPLQLTHSAQKRQAWQNRANVFAGAPGVPGNIHPGFPGDFAPGIINMHEVTIYDQHRGVPPPPPPPPSRPIWVKIDRVCRILFPLLFCAFNGAYWPILLIGSTQQVKEFSKL